MSEKGRSSIDGSQELDSIDRQKLRVSLAKKISRLLGAFDSYFEHEEVNNGLFAFAALNNMEVNYEADLTKVDLSKKKGASAFVMLNALLLEEDEKTEELLDVLISGDSHKHLHRILDEPCLNEFAYVRKFLAMALNDMAFDNDPKLEGILIDIIENGIISREILKQILLNDNLVDTLEKLFPDEDWMTDGSGRATQTYMIRRMSRAEQDAEEKKLVVESPVLASTVAEIRQWMDSIHEEIEDGDIVTSVGDHLDDSIRRYEAAKKSTLVSLPAPPATPNNDNGDHQYTPTLSIPIQAPHQFTETQPSPEYEEDGTPKEAPKNADSERPSVIPMTADVLSIPPDAPIDEPPRESIYNEEGMRPLFDRPTTLPPPREVVELEGIKVEYADGEDLENLEIFKHGYLILEKSHVSKGILEVTPALVHNITIGGDITNIIDLEYFPEDTIALEEDEESTEEEGRVGQYAVRKFMVELVIGSDGKVRGKYIDGKVTADVGTASDVLPEEDPFPVEIGGRIHIGHFLITVDRRHFTKKRYVEDSKKMIRQLAQVIFDVNTTDPTDDMKAHNAIMEIIKDLESEPAARQELVAYCRSSYAKGKNTHVSRMQKWDENSPICDSKVIEQLLLLIEMKRQDHEMVEDLDYTSLTLQQEASRRIKTYYDLANKAFGVKSETLVGLGSRIGKFGPASDNIVKRRRDVTKYRFELIKFIELQSSLFPKGMLSMKDVKKKTPKLFHQDIPAILEMRKYVQELAIEPTAEEIVEAMSDCQDLLLGDYFTAEEMTRMGLKLNKKFCGLPPEEPETPREDEGRRTRLPQARPSTIADYAYALAILCAKRYMGNIQSDLATMNYTNLKQNAEHIDFIQELLDAKIIVPEALVRDVKKLEIAKQFIPESLEKARAMIAQVNQER